MNNMENLPSMNGCMTLNIVGFLPKHPEVRTTSNGLEYITFTVGVVKSPEYPTWVNCLSFDFDTIRFFRKHMGFGKGACVSVSGIPKFEIFNEKPSISLKFANLHLCLLRGSGVRKKEAENEEKDLEAALDEVGKEQKDFLPPDLGDFTDDLLPF